MSTNDKRIAAIRQILGPNAVLLRVAPLGKNPTRERWQRVGIEKMSDPAYLKSLTGNCNIGVALGKQSDGLCTQDVDDNLEMARFIECNPHLDTLITSRVRGGNFWLQIAGDYPPSGKIKNKDGKAIGEWRADGFQTVISGSAIGKDETQETKYRVVSKTWTPARMRFEEIVWPGGWQLPWNKAPRPARGPSNGSEHREHTKAEVARLLTHIKPRLD